MDDGRLMLLDTAALYFRAFHGVPDTVRSPDGISVNAVRGLLDIIARLVNDFAPTRLIACWDDDWRPAWRVELIPSYKAHRVAETTDGGPDAELIPELLTPQIPIIVQTLTALGIPIVGKSGFEADDIIGTLAASSAGPVDVVTSDRDLFQVVDDLRDVRIIYTARGMRNLEIITDQVLHGKYGVTAAQYADFAVMRGDSSDGLPGVPGVGEKTAASLLAQFGTLAGVIAAANNPAVPLSAGIRAKVQAAAGYLTRAPAVVAVARDLDLPETSARIGLSDADRATVEDLSVRWGLGGAASRAVAALGTAQQKGAGSPQ
ncbi:MAG: 5'-3' exonuclease [Terrimesophilobacter sp.]